jgi:hypothetical protein
VVIDVTESGVTLTEADDLRRFHVEAPAQMSDLAVDSALRSSDAGHLEDRGQAVINVSWLRTAAADVSDDWPIRFQEMLAFAATKGWTAPDGTMVKGHLVRRQT